VLFYTYITTTIHSLSSIRHMKKRFIIYLFITIRVTICEKNTRKEKLSNNVESIKKFNNLSVTYLELTL
jgi:hypothetical protein